jgi:hypothetical protein
MTTGGMLDRTAIRLTKLVCNMERTIDSERNHGMPDLIHLNEHLWHSRQLYTFAQIQHIAESAMGEYCPILLAFLEISSFLWTARWQEDVQ